MRQYSDPVTSGAEARQAPPVYSCKQTPPTEEERTYIIFFSVVEVYKLPHLLLDMVGGK